MFLTSECFLSLRVKLKNPINLSYIFTVTFFIVLFKLQKLEVENIQSMKASGQVEE